MLLTKGDPGVQEKRIEDSQLGALFSLISIVPEKDVEAFLEVLDATGATAALPLSIGNSVPSDINPALETGMSAIWVDAHVWEHERRETDLLEEGRVIEVASLRQVPDALRRAHSTA